jgi:hypothetical protein
VPIQTSSIDPVIVGSTGRGFFWNHPEVGRRIPLDVLHVCETRSLKANSKSKEQWTVTRSEVRRVRWLGEDSRGTAAQRAMCGSALYRDAETSVRPACGVASSELHRADATRLHVPVTSNQ